MHCNSALSIRYGQVQICESSDSLPSLFVNVYSEVNSSSTYKKKKGCCQARRARRYLQQIKTDRLGGVLSMAQKD